MCRGYLPIGCEGAAGPWGTDPARPRRIWPARGVGPGARRAARARPVTEATGGRWTESDRPAGARRGRADHDAAVRVHPDRLGLDPRLARHREVHDAPFVREHRLERHGLSGRLHAPRDAARDLTELLLTVTAIPLDVDGHVHRTADRLRRDRRHDLLQRDEVLAAASDERTELAPGYLETLHPRPVVEGHIRLDVHLLEQRLQDTEPERELLGERRRRVLGLFGRAVRDAIGGGADRVRPARDVALIDDRLRLLRALFLGERQQHPRVDAAH